MALTFMQSVKDEKSIKWKSFEKKCWCKAKQWGKISRYPLMKDWEFSDDTQPMKSYQIVMKNSIIDGADKVEYWRNTDEVSKNMLSFIRESTRLKNYT